MQVKRYRLISASTAADLSREVNKELEEGWTLYGDPSMTCDQNENFYCQAVTHHRSF